MMAGHGSLELHNGRRQVGDRPHQEQDEEGQHPHDPDLGEVWQRPPVPSLVQPPVVLILGASWHPYPPYGASDLSICCMASRTSGCCCVGTR